MSFTHHQLAAHAAGLQAHFQASGWVVAVSGGLDSMSLLHALVQLQKDRQCPPIRVIHINHGLQSPADQWQRQVENKCLDYGLTCYSHRVEVCPQEQRKHGLEAAARNARYQVFTQHLEAGEVLLLGQHADDQTETLFLRVLRGAGVAGLRAMPQQRVLGLACLVRPLLHVRQTDLRDYAHTNGLAWCDDPSNQDSRFDRNFLRHKVLPLLRERWPRLDQRMATLASVMDDTQVLLDEVAHTDFLHLCGASKVGESLPCEGLKQLGRARRHNLLRYWMAQNKLPMPDHAAMQRIDTEFLYSAEDGQPYLQLESYCLRRHQGDLLLMLRPEPLNLEAGSWSLLVDRQALSSQSIAMPDGMLRHSEGNEVGLTLTLGDNLERRFRQGGERCQPSGRAHSQSLKKLLQEAGVPAWERDQLPLFFVNGELAMVADLWVVSGCEAGPESVAWCWQRQT